jgi:hypothetical protein
MSFCIVTLVYILVYLCGEGLDINEIKHNPAQDYDAVRRYWLRVGIPLNTLGKDSTSDLQCRCSLRLISAGRHPSSQSS